MNNLVLWTHETNVWTQTLTKELDGSFRLVRRYNKPVAQSTLDEKVWCPPLYPPPIPAPNGEPRQALEYILDVGSRFVDLFPSLLDPTHECVRFASTLAKNLACFEPPKVMAGAAMVNPHMTRLLDAFRQSETDGTSPLSAIFGDAQRNSLFALCRELKAPRTERRSHGNCSLSNIFSDPSLTTFRVPVGPEIAQLGLEMDLGWALADLVELLAFSPAFSQRDHVAKELLGAMVDGVRSAGANLSAERTISYAKMRLALHMIDFTATTGNVEAARRSFHIVFPILQACAHHGF